MDTEQTASGDLSGLCIFSLLFFSAACCLVLGMRSAASSMLISVTIHPELDSRLAAETASGNTDLAETTTRVAQTDGVAHFP